MLLLDQTVTLDIKPFEDKVKETIERANTVASEEVDSSDSSEYMEFC